ncbi:MAG: hypothetical protein KIT31_03080 [Deltaproteobacteria bacterium]|nr:hypothetical protein [Deltaproteobacteria bacterium]
MRTLMLSAVLSLAAIASTGCGGEKSQKDDRSGTSEAKQELPELTVDEVAAGLAAKQLTAVDCNGEKTRKKHGVIPGAILIEDEESYPASALPADKATKLVFYCGGPG